MYESKAKKSNDCSTVLKTGYPGHEAKLPNFSPNLGKKNFTPCFSWLRLWKPSVPFQTHTYILARTHTRLARAKRIALPSSWFILVSSLLLVFFSKRRKSQRIKAGHWLTNYTNSVEHNTYSLQFQTSAIVSKRYATFQKLVAMHDKQKRPEKLT